MRLLVPLATVLAAAALAGCAGLGGDEPAEQGETGTTPARAPGTTPDEVRLAVYERSYSECASNSLERLSAKYDAEPRPGPISLAVARAWVETFGAGPDAIRSGRDGCLQALREG